MVGGGTLCNRSRAQDSGLKPEGSRIPGVRKDPWSPSGSVHAPSFELLVGSFLDGTARPEKAVHCVWEQYGGLLGADPPNKVLICNRVLIHPALGTS